jgi:hypothetical protein
MMKGNTHMGYYNRPRRNSEPSDNVGDVTLNTEGDISVGIGGGLSIDTSDGSLGVQVGGITIDFDCD